MRSLYTPSSSVFLYGWLWLCPAFPHRSVFQPAVSLRLFWPSGGTFWSSSSLLLFSSAFDRASLFGDNVCGSDCGSACGSDPPSKSFCCRLWFGKSLKCYGTSRHLVFHALPQYCWRSIFINVDDEIFFASFLSVRAAVRVGSGISTFRCARVGSSLSLLASAFVGEGLSVRIERTAVEFDFSTSFDAWEIFH